MMHLIDGVTCERLHLPQHPDDADGADFRAFAEVRNTVTRETTGRDDDTLDPPARLALVRGSTYAHREQWVIREAGHVIGYVAVSMSTQSDDPVMGWSIGLPRVHWHRGIGSAAYPFVEERARAHGRTEMHVYVEHAPSDAEAIPSATGAGSVPRDHIATFLLHRGHSVAQVVRISAFERHRAAWDRVRALRDDARVHADGYDVIEWSLPTPHEFVDGYALMKSRMSTDAPVGDFTMVEEPWDEQRVRHHEREVAKFGRRLHVVAAREQASGELCAFTELAEEIEGPERSTHQEDTLVRAEHRGHRLGMLVKAEALLRWRDAQPESPRIVTYNAEENRPMLSINEALGFVPVGYEGAWKKTLTC